MESRRCAFEVKLDLCQSLRKLYVTWFAPSPLPRNIAWLRDSISSETQKIRSPFNPLNFVILATKHRLSKYQASFSLSLLSDTGLVDMFTPGTILKAGNCDSFMLLPHTPVESERINDATFVQDSFVRLVFFLCERIDVRRKLKQYFLPRMRKYLLNISKYK